MARVRRFDEIASGTGSSTGEDTDSSRLSELAEIAAREFTPKGHTEKGPDLKRPRVAEWTQQSPLCWQFPVGSDSPETESPAGEKKETTSLFEYTVSSQTLFKHETSPSFATEELCKKTKANADEYFKKGRFRLAWEEYLSALFMAKTPMMKADLRLGMGRSLWAQGGENEKRALVEFEKALTILEAETARCKELYGEIAKEISLIKSSRTSGVSQK